MSSDGTEHTTCKFADCDEPVGENEDKCLDCYMFIHSVNAGFPV